MHHIEKAFRKEFGDISRKQSVDKEYIESLFVWLKKNAMTAFDNEALNTIYKLTLESEATLVHKFEGVQDIVTKKVEDVLDEVNRKAEKLSTKTEKFEVSTPFGFDIRKEKEKETPE